MSIPDNSIRVIITGATGMVGEGVLDVCLRHAAVEKILVINRRPCGVVNPKLKEIIHEDFADLSFINEELRGYNACFFCMGVSSVGVKEEKYFKLTHSLVMEMAARLVSIDKSMTFIYVSGAGTDSSEKGKLMWARVKGKTENDLMHLPFKKVFPFRPGFIKPIKGMKNTNKLYTYLNWMFPIGRALMPKGFCTLEELGRAMIRATGLEQTRRVVDGNDIIQLSKEA